jgi:hypothetical protein
MSHVILYQSYSNPTSHSVTFAEGDPGRNRGEHEQQPASMRVSNRIGSQSLLLREVQSRAHGSHSMFEGSVLKRQRILRLCITLLGNLAISIMLIKKAS